MRLLRWLGVGLTSFIATACAPEAVIVHVDPVVDLGDYSTELIVEGPPTVQIGYYIEQLFSPLEEGGPCYVAYGMQGGTWTMPALRTTGIGSPVAVSCSIVTEDNERVGEVTSKTPLFLTPDGFLEIQAYPVPVQHAAPNQAKPIDDLYGKLATLTCEVSDLEDRSDSVTILVELVED